MTAPVASSPSRAASPLAIGVALATVYLVWGSTYLAMRVAVADVPPLLLAGLRFLPAGALLYVGARWSGAPAPDAHAWAAAGAVAVVTFVASYGPLTWAAQFVSSGTAALIASASPAWIAIGGAAGLVAGHRPTLLGVVGIVTGLAGVAVVLDPAAVLGGRGIPVLAAAALLLASLAWAAGGELSRWSALPASPILTAGMAMTMGGVMLVLAGLAAGEAARFELAAVAPATWLAVGYLSLVGSVVAYSAYVWLLRVDGPARASTHAFVNPIVAVLLGALLLGEPLTMRTAAAAALVVAGVALVWGAPRLAAARAGPPAPCRGCPA